MSHSVRQLVYKKVAACLQIKDKDSLGKIVSNLALKRHRDNGSYTFVLPLKSERYNIENEAEYIVQEESDRFNNITLEQDTISFHFNRNVVIKNILESNCHNVPALSLFNNKKSIVVEFSSPNVAKPFHMGHLRSTIIGNYVANLNSFMGNKVKSINYLGDWGTQFGLLQLGIDLACINDEQIKKNPIQSLYAAYVSANKFAETDEWIMDKARNIFRQLEIGDEITSERWRTIRQYTIEQLKKMYDRLGTHFDEYHWESMYSAVNIGEFLSSMRKKQLLVRDKDNREVVHLSQEKAVPIVKSDGTTLYITRDIAAADDRYERYNFDAMYYVVDKSQANHFNNMVDILRKMEKPWAGRLKHVQFGRIRGMSTRKGTAIFLEDILNETRDVLRENQRRSSTTKVSLDLNDNTADVLGVSAIIINDLRQRKISDYTFNWNAAFDVKGETGIKLQYAHCRLVNLGYNSGATLPSEAEPSVLTEPEVDNLIEMMGKYDEAILKSYAILEPCILAKYLFHLCSTTNKAIKVLRIKGEDPDLGNQRLLLFHTAKNILAQGMKLLGLQPLEKM